MGRIAGLVCKVAFAIVAIGSVNMMWAAGVSIPNCQPGTLASYISTQVFPSSCAIGILDYSTFSYHQITPNAPGATSIQVSLASSGVGFSFSQVGGAPISVGAGQTMQFEIDYDIVIDPAPILGGGNLRLDPPTGNVSIKEFYCNDSQYFFEGACLGGFAGAPETLTVGTIAPLQQNATITFQNPATRFQDVGILFTLTGGATGASFDALDSVSNILIIGTPEPGAAGSLLMGLLALGAGYKLRKRREF